jgi:glutamate carboxypeptidase
MDPLLALAESKQDHLIAFLQELVECESPSDDAPSVARCMDLIADRIADIAKVRRAGANLICDFRVPKPRSKDGQVLCLGHADTVYPLGTLSSTMPFRIHDGRISGPGVFDMKGGLAAVIYAVRCLIEAGVPVKRRVVLGIVSDEETGSHTSRQFTEKLAKESSAVIVAEPAAGPEGKAKTSRKGVGSFRVKVHGRAAHAGLDFLNGANAILELGRQLPRIAEFTDLSKGLTVSAGTVSGGTRLNVVPDLATCDFDVRVTRAKDWPALERRFQRLQPEDRRCRIEVEGDLNRPPLERNKANLALYKTARGIARELGFDLGETSVGGGSDGNFTSALGVPTLDGMGAVGEGAHTPGEFIYADHLPRRVALLGRLLAAL